MTSMLRGCDLSHWQDDKTFDEVSKYADFFILKATESYNYTDPTFKDRIKKLIKAGKCTGCYHFYRNSSVSKQVDNFINSYFEFKGMTVPVLDVEIAGLDWNKVRDFMEKFEAATKVRPILYVDMSRFNSCPADIKKKYKIWLARYISWRPEKIFAIHKNIIMWQYANKATFNKKLYKVDGDYFVGDYSNFMEYAKEVSE